MNDFQYRSFFEEIPAIAFVPIEFPYCNSATLALRLNREITPELLIDMNERLKELSHKEDYMFTPYFVTYAAYYKDIRLFRDSVIVAGLIMLVITLLGLFGYITDEVHRRSKEIAIRKVNGATSMDILRILSVNISFIAIPSILIGLGFAYMGWDGVVKAICGENTVEHCFICGLWVYSLVDHTDVFGTSCVECGERKSGEKYQIGVRPRVEVSKFCTPLSNNWTVCFGK